MSKKDIDHLEEELNDLNDIITENTPVNMRKRWKILIADDEQDIHDVTRIALKRLTYDGRGVEFLNAYKASEVIEILHSHSDIAVLILDVVMENENAGLDLVHYIRKQLKNTMIQIIIRTGYPGHAPEENVTSDYEINDYREKSELTSQRLKTSVITALRSYKSLFIIDEHRRDLKMLIESTAQIFKLQNKSKFELELLNVLSAFSSIKSQTTDKQHSGFVAKRREDNNYYIDTAIGSYQKDEGKLLTNCIEPEIWEDVYSAIREEPFFIIHNYLFLYCASNLVPDSIICLDGFENLNEWEYDLIKMFRENTLIAYENIYLNNEIEVTQRELIFTLSEVAESHSAETGNHVKRVGELTSIIAIKYGLSEEEAALLKMAASMHDLGKLSISDIILCKAGPLNKEEFEIMKTHSRMGYEMLKSSNRTLFKMAAYIALEHHENYDGTGYPAGLKGEEIHLISRITALADVFDALGNKRVYKKPWPKNKIFEYIKEQRGKKFDPKITDLFFEHIDEIIKVRELFPDE